MPCHGLVLKHDRLWVVLQDTRVSILVPVKAVGRDAAYQSQPSVRDLLGCLHTQFACH